MNDNKNLNNADEAMQEEINLEDLDKVSGGTLKDTHKRETNPASSSSKERV